MRTKGMQLAVALTFFGVMTSYSQVTTGTISGTVTDSTGAVLPGASVVILNEETGISRTVPTDAAGRYLAPSLTLGRYRVTISHEGFQTEVRSGIVLTVGRQAVVNFQLQVGAITTTVEVTGEAPLVDTVRGGLGALVEGATITELPLNGRDLAQLMTLQTGVIQYSANDENAPTLIVSGTRPSFNGFFIDGVGIETVWGDTPTGQSGALLGVEAVREFRVETNSYSAEFGRSSGGAISIVTKSGTNSLHGSVFEFFRNDNLDSTRWEANKLGEPKPEFKRNQFGFSLGGPLVRDRTFYFGNYEGMRQRLGVVKSSLTFSETLRQGYLSYPVTPETRRVNIAQNVLPYLTTALWPLPNGRIFADGTGEYNFSHNDPTNDDLYQIRVDHKLSDSDSLSVRYRLLDSDDRTTFNFPNEGETESERDHTASIEESRIISATLLNTFRLGFSRAETTRYAWQEGFPPALYFVPTVPQMGGLTVTGVSSVGNGSPGRASAVNSFQWSDDVSYTTGRNTMKFGVNINRVQFNFTNPGRDAATYGFNTIQDFFSGIPTGRFRGTIAIGYNDATRSFRNTFVGMYFQDDLRLTSRLTWNLGLRYEFTTTPIENHGRLANFRGDFDFIWKATMDDATLGNPWIENPSLKNLAPRTGFAWDVFGNGRTAVRGGFGLFFNQFDGVWYRATGFRMPPFLVELEASPGAGQSVPFPNIYETCSRENPFNPSNPLCSGRPAPDFPQWKFPNPYVMQYNLNVQHEVMPNTVVTVGYSGSRGVKLPAVGDINAHPAQEVNGRLVFPANLTARPNRNFDIMRWRHVGYDSSYHSFQMNVTRKYAQGLQMGGSYTFGKAIDHISGLQTSSDTSASTNSVPSIHHKESFRGLSAFDARHVFNFNSTYELPIGPGKALGSGLTGVGKWLLAGWQLGGVVALSAGFPTDITIGSRFGFLGHGTEYPDLAPGASNNPTSGTSLGCTLTISGGSRVIAAGTPVGTPDMYFDPCAFAFPAAQTLGNLGRNVVIMGGRAVVDFVLTKNMELTEAAKLQFRFEAFNLFNRVNLGIPSRSVFNARGQAPARAGEINSTMGTARQLQLGLRLTF